jgi:hypothetical protein
MANYLEMATIEVLGVKQFGCGVEGVDDEKAPLGYHRRTVLWTPYAKRLRPLVPDDANGGFEAMALDDVAVFDLVHLLIFGALTPMTGGGQGLHTALREAFPALSAAHEEAERAYWAARDEAGKTIDREEREKDYAAELLGGRGPL